jgi:hypothetical protein
MSFEPDDDLAIASPPATDEDRTDAWIDLLIQAGLIDG